MMTRAIGLLFFLSIASCSCSQVPKKLDEQNAVSAGDLTVLLSGCGANQIGIGYIACRQVEGENTDDTFITIHTPPQVNCDEDACVYYKIFIPREGGRGTLEGSIKKSESSAKIAWNDLTDKPRFDIGDRGFYAVSLTIHYKSNGQNLKSYSSGYIFMHVTKRGYLSLNESSENENFVWIWNTPTNQKAKMTTGGRVYVSPSENIRVSWLQ
jgi:hypothetical protein